MHFIRSTMWVCFVLFFYGCTSHGVKLVSIQSDGTTGIPVKDIDSSANPYRGDYEDWDIWLLKHAASRPCAISSVQREDIRYWSLTGRVDENGYLIPQREYLELYEKAIGNYSLNEIKQDYTILLGQGVDDPELRKRWELMEVSVSSKYYPQIPKWLLKLAPTAAMFTPQGEVLTRGVDNSGISTEGLCCGQLSAWSCYSYDGKYLRGPEKEWWKLFFDPKNAEQLTYVYQDDNTLSIYDNHNRAVGVCDLNGNMINPADSPIRCDGHYYRVLGYDMLKKYYDAQQATGLWKDPADTFARAIQ
jgi:hypothetical protein